MIGDAIGEYEPLIEVQEEGNNGGLVMSADELEPWRIQ